jgi:hypothetical protein
MPIKQQREMEVSVKGRTFMVKYECLKNETVSPVEFHAALEEIIQMSGGIRAGSLTGMSQNSLRQNFTFREVSSDEQIEQYHAVETIKQFMEGIDAVGDRALIETVSPQFAKVFQQLREGELTAEEGVSIMNDAIALARQNQHQKHQQRYLDIAEQWANKPNLTLREACHGVAYDTYCVAHPEQPKVMARQEYGQRYDSHFVDQIKNRQIKAAKDLFGE